MQYTPIAILILIILIIYYIYIRKTKKIINKIYDTNSKFILLNSNKEWLILNDNMEFEFTTNIDGGIFTISKKGNLLYIIKNIIYEIGLDEYGKLTTHRCPSAKFSITNNDELICNDYLYLNENIEFTIRKCKNIKLEYVDKPEMD